MQTRRPSHRPALRLQWLHTIRPEIFDWMPEDEVFSIIDVYLKAATFRPILGYPHDLDVWLDVGNPESLKKASEVWRQIKNFSLP